MLEVWEGKFSVLTCDYVRVCGRLNRPSWSQFALIPGSSHLDFLFVFVPFWGHTPQTTNPRFKVFFWHTNLNFVFFFVVFRGNEAAPQNCIFWVWKNMTKQTASFCIGFCTILGTAPPKGNCLYANFHFIVAPHICRKENNVDFVLVFVQLRGQGGTHPKGDIFDVSF